MKRVVGYVIVGVMLLVMLPVAFAVNFLGDSAQAEPTGRPTVTVTVTGEPQAPTTETVTITATVTPDPVTNTATVTETVTTTATATETTTATPSNPTGVTCSVVKVAGRNIQFSCVDSEGNTIAPGQVLQILAPEDIIREVVREVEVLVPGPVKTVLKPRPAKTILVPQPARTVTETVTDIKTVIEPRFYGPQPTKTVIVPTGTATETVPGPTETVTVNARQEPPTSGTIDNDRPGPIIRIPGTNLTTTEVVGLGFLALLALMVLILLGMYSGYILGYKDSEQKEARFLRALRDQAVLRKK